MSVAAPNRRQPSSTGRRSLAPVRFVGATILFLTLFLILFTLAASPSLAASDNGNIQPSDRYWAPIAIRFSVPSVAEILLAQQDSTEEAPRRRRRRVRRPGGSRGGDVGRPEESSSTPSPVEPAPVAPTDDPTSATTPDPSENAAPGEAPRDQDSNAAPNEAITPSETPVIPETAPAPDAMPKPPEIVPPSRETSSGSDEEWTLPSRGGSRSDSESRRRRRSDDGQSSGSPNDTARRRDRPASRFENQLPDYEFVPLPDRWRIIENLGVNERWYDPYNQNTLKADRPIPGTKDWFVNLNFIYDGLVELRRIPTPTGVAGDTGQGLNDLFADGEQLVTSHTFLASVSLIQGDTTFRPPDWEFRITAATNVNYAEVSPLGALKLDPRENNERFDHHIAIQEAFVDKHLWNRTDRFDFDSLRIGIQPFISDFRGFLFESQEPGVRLFGNFANNRIQYNLAWFRRLNKDTNSGLNDIESVRDDDIFIANFYYQDFPVLGFNLEGIVAYNRNREADRRDFDDNSNLVIPAPVGLGQPHEYDVVYLGLAGDGHIERLNLTFQLYGALGDDEFNSIAQRTQEIRAFFAAVEASYDIDWFRIKAFGLYSSGDDDPFDDRAEGFDTILDNPNFAGGTTSFWQRQQIPFVFGGGVIVSGQNSIVPSLRSSKNEGQSNFVNPGLWLGGVGADFDILPELRLVTNFSYLAWDSVQVLEVLRQQGRLDREIGWDLSAGLIYRPLFSNNIIFRASGAVLLPGSGYEELFDERSDEPPYSVLLNLTLTY